MIVIIDRSYYCLRDCHQKFNWKNILVIKWWPSLSVGVIIFIITIKSYHQWRQSLMIDITAFITIIKTWHQWWQSLMTDMTVIMITVIACHQWWQSLMIDITAFITIIKTWHQWWQSLMVVMITVMIAINLKFFWSSMKIITDGSSDCHHVYHQIFYNENFCDGHHWR